jgi:hypothetical protein
MSTYRDDLRQSLAERVAQAPRQVDPDRADWDEIRDWVQEIEDRHVECNHLRAACVVAAILLLLIVFAPAVEALARHAH